MTILQSSDYRTPGQFLQALLDERGWTKRVLAIVLDVEPTALGRIIKDTKPIDATLALSLSEIFAVAPEQFLALQQSYDLAKARLAVRPDPSRADRARLYGDLPIAEMITRGWLNVDDVRDVAKVEAELVRFFGAASADQIEILPHAAKKTEVTVAATPVQLAWLYRVKQIANDMLVPRYSPSAVREAVKKLDALLLSVEEARKVPRILAECGIRFVIVESLTSAKIDGVCFWLNDLSPVIGLTMRFDRIDNFWFVLRHEIEHVLRGHGRKEIALDVELEGDRAGTGDTVTEEERVANEAAANFCVPKNQLDAFIARKAPFFAERDFLGFAKTLNIHPGLIAGQLQHRTRRYERFRAYQVKIRHAVAPGAMVDGWGDVAPIDPEPERT